MIPSASAEDGGPAAALAGMLDGIAARGAVVTLATTVRNRLDKAPDLGGNTILRFPRSLPGSWKYSRPLGRWLRENIRDFDLIHVHAMFSYATVPACRAAIGNRVPLVIRPLGSLDPWSLRQSRWKKRPYLELVERYHLNGASVIHVTSEAERRGVEELGYGDKARVISLGVSLVSTPEEVQEAHSRSAVREPLRILFLSRLHPKKRLPLLISALGRLRDDTAFALRIAGSGTSTYIDELRRRCADSRIAERVTFTGHVSGAEKQELFRWADVFVLPSLQENFSIAAVEAMAAGVPVILTRDVGVAADVADAGAGVIVAGETAALADAIRRLGTDPALRLRMGLAGRALVQRRFTWSAASDSLMDLYEELRVGKSE